MFLDFLNKQKLFKSKEIPLTDDFDLYCILKFAHLVLICIKAENWWSADVTFSFMYW